MLQLSHLVLVGKDKRRPTIGLPCVSLAHNEENLIGAFLAHYRQLGLVDFIIVDDGSTDGTLDMLLDQPDVTVLRPKLGSRYDQDKVIWRSQLLDACAANQWCLVPDLDELLILPVGYAALAEFIVVLNLESASAVITIMVDMYADAAVSDHVFVSGNLIQTFPYFDSPYPASAGYRLLTSPPRWQALYPSPAVKAYGGMRERLFLRRSPRPPKSIEALIDRFAKISGSLAPSAARQQMHQSIRSQAGEFYGRHTLNCTKLALLKWRPGAKFSGGPHSTSVRMSISKHVCVFLHFPITRGMDGIRYIVDRGRHADGSFQYRQILENAIALRQSPLDAASKRYVNANSVVDFLR